MQKHLKYFLMCMHVVNMTYMLEQWLPTILIPRPLFAHPTYDMYYCNTIKYNAFN